MKKSILRPASILVGLVVIASLLLAACSGPVQNRVASNGKPTVTVTYWDWWVTQGPTIDKEIKLFEEQYPHIKIKKMTQVSDKYPDLLQLAFKGETAPDVFLIPEQPKLSQQVKQGWFLPLNDYANEEWKAQFPKGSFAEGANVFDGQIYTAPFDGPAPWLQFYVNTQLFKEAGLVDENGEAKAPRTWDEVRDYAKIITEKSGGKVYGYGFGNKQKNMLLRQMAMTQNSGAPGGIDGWDTRVGKYTWASNPVYSRWIKFFMGMKDDGSIVPNALSMDDEMARVAFAEGRFAMLVGGVWNQAGWTKTNPDFKDYTVVQLPYEGPQQASYFYHTPGGKQFAISAQSKHPDEAWLWFQWLYSRDAAERWVKAGQGMRIFPDVNKPEWATTPQFGQFMKLAQADDRIAPAPDLVHPEMAEVKTQQTMPDMANIMEGIYTGQIKDFEGALRDLESRQNNELDRAVKEAQDRGVKVDRQWWAVPDWDITQNYMK